MVDPFQYAADLLVPSGKDGWDPLPHQIPPAGHWFAWMLLGGRGAGKTAAAAKTMHDHVNGPPCLPNVPGGHWPAIIAPTLGDGVTSCVNGPSGLRKWDPKVRVRDKTGGTVVSWPNGVEAKIFGAHTPEDVERLRSGGNRCFVWAEEMAAWRYMVECWQHMRYGLRVGPWPHVVVSTTPKALKLIKELAKRAKLEEGKRDPYIVITKATTEDNPHLDARVKTDLYDDYGGTRLGRQELHAEILEDVENALWTPEDIELYRLKVSEQPPRYPRIAVGVDPAAKEGGDDTGIVVVGMLPNLTMWHRAPNYWPHLMRPHMFTLADYSVNGKPDVWARRVVEAMNDFDAHIVIAEVNNGGEMVEHTIHTVDDTIPVKSVHATRGKERRAEPISSVFQQGRGHHVGMLPKLEDQMVTWDPIEPDESWSPDRMDAMVWAASHLVVQKQAAKQYETTGRRLAGRR